MICKVARAFRTIEREELEAELARKLCELKSRKPQEIRNWKGYVAKFLYNKASDIIRSWRLRESKEQGYRTLEEAEAEDHVDFEFSGALGAEDPEPMFDFAWIWQKLDPELQQFWRVLLEERGNQTRTARRLGMHRNTIILWIKRIRAVIDRHGIASP